jgi:hypothetical protein
MNAPRLRLVDAAGLKLAQAAVTSHHYLRKPVDVRSMPEAYEVRLSHGPVLSGPLGYLIVGRPEATRCKGWYGSIEDVAAGWAPVTRWQVLNLARVWLDPAVQPGGMLYRRELIPGFIDRRGAFRSTLASEVVRALADQVVRDYLVRRPPCFLEEPYQLRWLLSYCDTSLHRGTIYKAAGFELFRTNARGLQTWRLPLRALTPAEDVEVRRASCCDPRARTFRRRREQGELFGRVSA